jgi:hypothetical protein
MSRSLAEELAAEVKAFFSPLVRTEGDEKKLLGLFSSIGWPLDRIPGVDKQQVVTSVGKLADTLNDVSLLAGDSQSEPDVLLAKFASKLAPAFVEFRKLEEALPAGLPLAASGMATDLMAFLATDYLRRRSEPLFHLLRILGIIVDPVPAPVEVGDGVSCVRGATAGLRLRQLIDLFSQPEATFVSTYWPHGLGDHGEGAKSLVLKLWDLALALGLQPGFSAILDADDLPAQDSSLRSATLAYDVPLADGSTMRAGVRWQLGDDGAGGPAVRVEPFGVLSFLAEFERVRVSLSGSLEANPFVVTTAGVRQLDAAMPPVAADLRITWGSSNSPAFQFGAASGTHVSVSEFALYGGLRLREDVPEVVVGLELKPLDFRLGVGGGDGFLSSILPAEGLVGKEDIALQWSNKTGIAFKGARGLTVDLLEAASLGPIGVQGMTLAVIPNAGVLKLELTATISARIGAMLATVEHLGLGMELGSPDQKGNLSPVDVLFHFLPPDGIGLAIDAQGVVGGGFIKAKSGNYEGILQLSVQNRFSITAIGILTTRTPEGGDTFSLKLFGMAEFSPIQLGFGFSVSGLGVAIAIECAMDEDAIRKAVYEGSLRSLLFPPDPITNAVQIIEDLKAFFPPHDGCTVIGAMAKLGWGPGTPLVKADVGIFLELSDSVRVMLAGVAYAMLPNERSPILTLNIQLLGLLDFKKKTLAIDSSLHGSKLLDWALDGDVALRSSWGDRPGFVFSAGGFFPGYQPPADFPALDRIALTIGSGNPRIMLSSYLAVTENTVQLGAAVDFYWHKKYDLPWPCPDVHIEVDGGTGFDALVEFNPFFFTAVMYGHFGLKCNGDNLLTVRLDMTLSGPNNYHFVGTFSFEVFEFDFDVTIDEKFGRKLPEVYPPLVNPADILLAEATRDENWTFSTSEHGACGVAFVGSSSNAESLADPFTSAGFVQRALPLGVPIARIGQVDARDGSYDIELNDAEDLDVLEVREPFALASYLELSDAEKLAAPPFESLKAGFEIGFGASDLGATVRRTMCFEDIPLPKERERSAPRSRPIPSTAAVMYACTSAGRRLYTDRRTLGPDRSAKAILAEDPKFHVLEAGEGRRMQGLARLREAPTKAMSFAEALAAQRARRARNEQARVVSESLSTPMRAPNDHD